MSGTVPLDRAWLAAHPLPPSRAAAKAARGRVLIAGGSRRVPGGTLLTGEAALRTGAGKVRIATVEAAAIAIGIAFPEAGIVPLPEDHAGQIAIEAGPLLAEQAETHDAFVFGPGMGGRTGVAALVRAALAGPRGGLAVLLDAAALVACAHGLEDVTAAHGGRVVMTPHHGEMASLLDRPEEAIARDPVAAAREAATRFSAVIALKDAETVIAAPDGAVLLYRSDWVGLGTAGSGDVLAGVIGGLLARGIAPLAATAWGVWLHGAAGRAAAARIGPTGFLARELLPDLPRLIASHDGG